MAITNPHAHSSHPPTMRPMVLIGISVLALLSGCTSLGHESRAEPQLERKLPVRPNAVAVVGSGELATATELLLVSRGVKVYASPVQLKVDPKTNATTSEAVTRYVVNVTSVDLDVCLPEGSRQMHFNISVVDVLTNERVFFLSGDYGCKDTLVRRFERWYFP